VDDVIFAIQRCSHSNDMTSRLVRQRTSRAKLRHSFINTVWWSCIRHLV